jgi:chaperonin GroEL
VVGPSQAEIRERKDRAEDAWCAVRSATKHGTLPGGGWALAQLSKKLEERSLSEKDKSKQLALNILSQAFLDPIRVLYSNAGFTEEEIDYHIKYMKENPDKTFDLQNHEWVDAFDILDSAPAVLEAIRNSISIASLIGTLGGVVVFDRDREADLEDARSAAEFVSAIQEGESTATQINDADRNSY